MLEHFSEENVTISRPEYWYALKNDISNYIWKFGAWFSYCLPQ